jgi:hypothetical protein
MLAAETPVDAVVGDEEIEYRRHHRFAVRKLQALHRDVAEENVGVIRAEEMIVFAIAEIREADRQNTVFHIRQ